MTVVVGTSRKSAISSWDEKVSDLVLGVPINVVERGGLALAGGQAADGLERPLPFFPLLGDLFRAGAGCGDRLSGIHQHGLDALAAGEAVAVLKHDALEPAGKGARLAQVGQAVVRLDERLLSRVLGQLKVAQDRVGVSVGHVLEPAHDLPVCVLVVALCTLD
ncbi:MAG: hypothetical protein P8Z33_13895 [Gammaproteobacteria bacterium]